MAIFLASPLGVSTPKRAQVLSALGVRRLTTPGNYAVGGVPGLILQVKESGARSWLLRVMVGKKRGSIGLGSYPGTSPEDARKRSAETTELIRRGIDPIE